MRLTAAPPLETVAGSEEDGFVNVEVLVCDKM